MKILHVIDSGGLYGAEVMLLALAHEQRRVGQAPTILSIGTPEVSEKALEIEARARGIPVLPWRMRKGFNLLGGYRIARVARRLGFDLMHSHGYKGNILLGSLPRRVRALPLVATLHGWTAPAGWSRLGLNQWVERRILRRLDAVVAVNSSMSTDPCLPRSRRAGFRVIENGIPADTGSHHTAKSDPVVDDFCGDRFIVGAVGRLSMEKGFDVLVDALTEFCPRHLDVKAVILGEGPDRALLEQRIADTGLENRILLPGYRRDAASYMHRFGVLALSSRTEGLPITLLEAMAARVPIVATKVGGVSDVLAGGACGLLIEPGDAAALAAALEQVYLAQDRGEAMTARAYRRVSERYTISRMTQEYMDLYRSVLSPVTA